MCYIVRYFLFHLYAFVSRHHSDASLWHSRVEMTKLHVESSKAWVGGSSAAAQEKNTFTRSLHWSKMTFLCAVAEGSRESRCKYCRHCVFILAIFKEPTRNCISLNLCHNPLFLRILLKKSYGCMKRGTSAVMLDWYYRGHLIYSKEGLGEWFSSSPNRIFWSSCSLRNSLILQ